MPSQKFELVVAIVNLFNVYVGVHQGSDLSPLLFKIVMEALSIEFRPGCA